MVPASASETQGGKKGVLVGLFTSLTTELQIQCMVLLLLKDSRLLVFIGWGGAAVWCHLHLSLHRKINITIRIRIGNSTNRTLFIFS
jgi:hypothetical protein